MPQDLVASILASGSAAAISTCIVIFLGLVFWFYVIPQLQEKKQLEVDKKELEKRVEEFRNKLDHSNDVLRDYVATKDINFKLDKILDELDSIYRLHESDTEKLVKTLEDLDELVKDFSKDDSETSRKVASNLQDIQGQLNGIMQRIFGLSGAIYAITGARNPEGFGDLRAPK